MARTANNHHVLPLFCDDLIASCVDMTPARFGAYMRLLCYAWSRGGLPNDEQACGRIAGGFAKGDWKAIRQRLVLLDEGKGTERLSHQRLELERAAVADLKESKSRAGQDGAKKRWGSGRGNEDGRPMPVPLANGWQNDGRPIVLPLAEGCEGNGKTIAPTPTPTPSPVLNHTPPANANADEPWAGQALDRWAPFRDQWNSTPGAEPWRPLTPPTGSLWVDRISEPAWLEQYPLALKKLSGLRRFDNAVTLTQFLSDGWVARIVAGDFDKPMPQRGPKARPVESNF